MTTRRGHEPYKCRFCPRVCGGKGALKKHEQSKSTCPGNENGAKYTERTENERGAGDEGVDADSIPELKIGDCIIERDPLTPDQGREVEQRAGVLDAMARVDGSFESTSAIMDGAIKVTASRDPDGADVNLSFEFTNPEISGYSAACQTKEDFKLSIKRAMLCTREWLAETPFTITDVAVDSDGAISQVSVDRVGGPPIFLASEYMCAWIKYEVEEDEMDDGAAPEVDSFILVWQNIKSGKVLDQLTESSVLAAMQASGVTSVLAAM